MLEVLTVIYATIGFLVFIVLSNTDKTKEPEPFKIHITSVLWLFFLLYFLYDNIMPAIYDFSDSKNKRK